jgi:hypothetical protein
MFKRKNGSKQDHNNPRCSSLIKYIRLSTKRKFIVHTTITTPVKYTKEVRALPCLLLSHIQNGHNQPDLTQKKVGACLLTNWGSSK